MVFYLFLIWTFFIFARPQDFFPFLGPLRPAFLLTAAMLILSFFAGRWSFVAIFSQHAQVKRYYLFYLLMIFGLPFTLHLGHSVNFILFNYLINVIYFSFFIIWVDNLERLRKALLTVFSAAVFYAVMSLLSRGIAAGRFRFGTMYDPNDLACFLISMFPLGFYFLGREQSAKMRAMAAGSIMLSLVVTLMTGSRGGLIGLIVVGFYLFFSRLSPLKIFQRILLLFIFAIVLVVNSDKIDTERFSSLLNPQDDYNVTSEQGRLTVWKRGWEIMLRQPLSGVGVDNFPLAIGGYRQEIGEIPRWQAAHNPYIQVLTELGIPGFLLFVYLIVSSFKAFLQAAREPFASLGPRDQRTLMGRALLIGFIGHLATAFFLSMAYSMMLTFFLAASVAIQQVDETAPHLESDDAEAATARSSLT